jgi:ribonuclease HII
MKTYFQMLMETYAFHAAVLQRTADEVAASTTNFQTTKDDIKKLSHVRREMLYKLCQVTKHYLWEYKAARFIKVVGINVTDEFQEFIFLVYTKDKVYHLVTIDSIDKRDIRKMRLIPGIHKIPTTLN